MSHKYEEWSKERLVAHILKLENTFKNARRGLPSSQPFDFSQHPTRKIALRFTYDGTYYNGLEYQKDLTPLPTVEETLWEALVKTRLVDSEGDFNSHGWEKCGRTDRGVSAAGQVVSFWIRSKEGGHPQREALESADTALNLDLDDSLAAMSGWDEAPTNNTLPEVSPASQSSPRTSQEFDYVTLLNSVLPLTLRVLSWSPVDPNFSARFNCRGRHYKYFFVSRGLNIEAMQEGAKRLVGEHDWRNLCKIDPAKFRLDAEGEDRWSFRRIVRSAEVNPVHPSKTSSQPSAKRGDDDQGELYVFDLVGTAFLYNQVRHIMAVLFLIGSGLEHPSIITALLNVDPSNTYPPYESDEPVPPVITGKPTYQMADALPLVLWDCKYDKEDVTWVGDLDSPVVSGDVEEKQVSINGLYAKLRSLHERSWVHLALHDHFLQAASRYHRPPKELLPFPPSNPSAPLPVIPNGTVIGIPLGGGTYRNTRYAGGKGYVKLLDMHRLDVVEVVWEKWKNGKGAKSWKGAT
ncbi:pseudouridine synthase [Irpex rosettiformis]|uniref:Pseudouridine synthase n=1 Tax=Irpex rosettiformis TaxID=378272 RepID=A0ACB8TUU5_9APHY|nr:pseudouridine synthase [Irpex rosettiformis]